MPGMTTAEILASFANRQTVQPKGIDKEGPSLGEIRELPQKELGWDELRELLPESPYGPDFAATARRYGIEMGHRSLLAYTVFSITTAAPWYITITVPGQNMYKSRCVCDDKGGLYEFQTKDEAVIAMSYMAKIAGKGIAREAERCQTIRAYLKEKGIIVPLQAQTAPLRNEGSPCPEETSTGSTGQAFVNETSQSVFQMEDAASPTAISSTTTTVPSAQTDANLQRILDSLLFYLAFKHCSMRDIQREEFERRHSDYVEFLRDTAFLAESTFDHMMHKGRQYDPMERYRNYMRGDLLPLENIQGVKQEQYRVILDKVFTECGGVMPGQPVNKSSWFENYVNTFERHDEKVSLRNDVTAIWDRLMANIDPNLRRSADGEEDGIECVPGLMNPYGKDRASGLVVGRVQSGKTRNYIGLALKAFDEGWNMVIVLTSNNTALAWQTEERLRSTVFNDKITDNGVVVRLHNFEDIQGGLDWNGATQFNGAGKYLGLALKERHHLKDIQHWLGELGEDVQHTIRLLVIDDECDSSTPDTQSTRGMVFSEQDFEEYIQRFEACDVIGDWLDGVRKGLDIFECSVDERVLDNVGDLTQRVARHIENKLGSEDEDACLCRERLKTMLGEADAGLVDGMLNDADIADFVGLKLEIEHVQGQHVHVRDLLIEYLGQHGARKNFAAAFRFLFNVVLARSTINRAVCRIVSRTAREDFPYKFEKVAYMGYTATPVANLVNEVSKDNPIAPDFAFSMHLPCNYLGFEKIMGLPQDLDADKTKLPIVSLIDDYDFPHDINGESPLHNEENVLVTPFRRYEGGAEFTCDDELVVTVLRDDHSLRCEWNSLKDAICWTFCSAAARRKMWEDSGKADEISARWTTMLINVNLRMAVHRKLQQWIYSYLKKIRDDETARTAFKERCRRTWEEQIAKLSREFFSTNVYSLPAESDYPAWDEISLQLFQNILPHMTGGTDGRDLGRIHVCNINSDNDTAPAYNGRNNLSLYKQISGTALDDCHIWILCGGNTISRGLTLEGLTASYFNRIADTTPSDTVTQMGRWFGYRAGYELLPRAWMTRDTVREMKNMCREEMALHKEIKTSFEAGHSPKNGEHAIKILQSLGRDASSRMAAYRVTGSGFNDPAGTFNKLSVDADSRKTFIHALNDIIHDGLTDAVHRRHNARNCRYFENVGVNHLRRILGAIKKIAQLDSTDDVAMLEYEVSRYPEIRWDVAINDNRRGNVGQWPVLSNDSDIGLFARVPDRCDGQVICFDKIQNNTYQGNFGYIETCVLKVAECNLVNEKIRQPFWSRYPDGFTKETLIQHVMAVRDDNSSGLMLYDAVRNFTPFNISRRSSIDYRDEVFRVYRQQNDGRDHNPILQITFLKPPDKTSDDVPFAVASYYWPGHPIDNFVIGDNRGQEVNMDDVWYLANQVKRILDERHFLHKDVIRKELGTRAGGRVIDQASFNRILTWHRHGYGIVNVDMLPNVCPNAIYYSKQWCHEINQFRDLFIADVRRFVNGIGRRELVTDERFGRVFRGDAQRAWDDFCMFEMEIV